MNKLRISLVLLSILALIGPGSAEAFVFTVGPDGLDSEIQTALEDAFSGPGNHEIRVQAGTYNEQIAIFTDMNNGTSGCQVFDASDIAAGPVGSVGLPQQICVGTHAYWARREVL